MTISWYALESGRKPHWQGASILKVRFHSRRVKDLRVPYSKEIISGDTHMESIDKHHENSF